MCVCQMGGREGDRACSGDVGPHLQNQLRIGQKCGETLQRTRDLLSETAFC